MAFYPIVGYTGNREVDHYMWGAHVKQSVRFAEYQKLLASLEDGELLVATFELYGVVQKVVVVNSFDVFAHISEENEEYGHTDLRVTFDSAERITNEGD